MSNFEISERIHQNLELKDRTLYGVGGPARYAIEPRTHEELVAACAWMYAQEGPKLVLGGGANVLIRDAGYPGIVLLTDHLTTILALGDDRYRVECGVSLDVLVLEVLLQENYEGTGGLTGIPGTVGGALYMNAGTENGTICEWVESLDILSPEGLSTVAITPSLYAYRSQKFCPQGNLIARGIFHFTRSDADQRAVYDHYIQRRLEKQPQGKCCGSVFKNPDGNHAGKLIEACGLKGTRRGGAVISELHGNFILNEGSATAADILELIELAQETVREAHGIQLETEVKIIGVE